MRKARMTNRDVCMKADTMVAEHGVLTSEYVLRQLNGVLDNRAASEDWCRVAAAVDALSTPRRP